MPLHPPTFFRAPPLPGTVAESRHGEGGQRDSDKHVTHAFTASAIFREGVWVLR